jgi:hypothetical protein
MTETVVRAIADEIADEIWSLVDDIRAQVGAGSSRDDEQRILDIRRKLKRRLASMAELLAQPSAMPARLGSAQKVSAAQLDMLETG